MKGSSPLSRGILSCHPIKLGALGIIPALAGNTAGLGKGLYEVGDHPRSRGEYDALGAGAGSDDGSSPLSRGIHSS